MCGIAAIFAYSADAPGVDRDELIAIRDHMTARGPDGAGAWISANQRVGLAHRRLSILDLSEAAAQPMWNGERTLCVTFNGEIYNFQALRSWLQARGCSFHSHSDTEVLLHLYAEKGADMVHELRGMYAFAIWDERKRCLFLARDPFGIKPLYYADDGRTIRVASQVKALLRSKHIDTAPDPAAHVGFFLWGHVPDPFTMYRGIKALPAGHTLTVSAGCSPFPAPCCFCSIPELLSGTSDFCPLPSDLRPLPPARSPLPAPGSNLLRSALTDSISHHLISDVPVGVFQSAGLDSSTITALVSEQHPHVRTVTLGFEEYRGTPQDEVPLAELVARSCGTDHATQWVTRRDFEGSVESLFAAMDSPSLDGVNTYFVSRAARQAGLKVALSGLGGDELFGGYPSFHDVPRLVRASAPFAAVPALGRAFRVLTSPVLKRFTSPKYAGIFEYGSSWGGAYLLRRGSFMPWELPGLLDPDLVREGWQRLNTIAALDDTANLRPLISPSGGTGDSPVTAGDPPGGPSTPDLRSLSSDRLRLSALELCWYMRHQLLRDSDWAGMAHSLEIRVPLVDLQLLRSLLPALRSAHPPTKADMAATPRIPLPAALLSRSKTGFTVPVREWLLNSQRTSDICPPSSGFDRGLRGWARHVYERFGWPTIEKQTRRRRNAPTAGPSGSAAASPATLSAIGGRGAGGEVAAPPNSLTSDLRSPTPAPGSSLPAPRSSPSALRPPSSDLRPLPSLLPAPCSALPARILLYRIGQLGDTIVALPSMWAIRKQFPRAHITLLCDRHPGKSHVLAADLLRGTGVCDAFESYDFNPSLEGRLVQPFRMLKLLRRLRSQKFDTLVYLAPSTRTPNQVERDRKYFAAAGIERFIGMSGFVSLPSKTPGRPLEATAPEADLLLARLAADGITVPDAAQGLLELCLGNTEEAEVDSWLARLPHDGDGIWLGVGPGSKMPAKRWPEERFQSVVAELIEQFGVWPVVFGGAEDHDTGERLVGGWGRGYNAAGALSLRGAAAALRRCALFLGNDTGTMHLAAAVGVPCVAIFSAREWPGMWAPCGVRHRVLRSQIDCEGCGLVECVQRQNECLRRITPEDVLQSARSLLANQCALT